MNSHALWYLTRASGAVALLLLTATTLLGVLTSTRWHNRRWPRFAVADLHRNLTLLALVFISVHVLTAVVDSYAPVGVLDVLVPFVSRYRPIWVGLGALALDLLLALTVTSMLRKRVGYRLWRALHWAAYAAWPLALAHGFGTGSDARFGWLAALAFGCLALVTAAGAIRLAGGGPAAIRLSAGAAGLVLAAVIVVWYWNGPAQHGWAARAGTPPSLLKRRAVHVPVERLAAVRTDPPPRPQPIRSFAGRLVGHLSSSGPDAAGDAAVAIAAAVRGHEPGVVRITLWGTAVQGGGVAMSDSQVTFADVARRLGFSGRIVALDGNRVVADVTSSSGKALRLSMVLQIHPANHTVTGGVRAVVLRG